MQISKAHELYVKDKSLLGYSPYTLKAYNLQNKLLIRYLGDKNVEDVQIHDLKEYLLSQNHLKPSSLGHRIRYIRSFFRWCLEEGYISRNPASKLKEPKMGKRVPKNLTEEEIELLREGCKTPLEHALLEILYATGCRIGEIYKLNRNDINWENRSIIVNGKGNKQREVYFTVKCAIWLKKYIKQRKDNEISLFTTERKPYRRMSIAQLRYIIKRIAKRSEIEINVYPHKMRHSFAVTLLDNGMPIEGVQDLLGHTKLETTKLYCQLSGERRRQLYRQYFR